MTKNLRSLIHEKFPLELRVKIEVLSRRRDLVNREKQEELFKLFREYNIEGIVQLGPGTNRYAFKIDGFVIKVATDKDGKIDNFKEFKMAKRLFPYVTKTYEVSENGTFLVAEYIQPFASYSEMCRYADRIREILTKLSSVYLIGDVGISSVNYANWGLRIGTEDPVCLDFAYVYEVSSELFVCRNCNNGTMLLPNKDFTELFCPNKGCGRRYKFEDIRARIGNDIHRHEIGDLTLEGYLLHSSNVQTELDDKRSNYLARKKKDADVKSSNQESHEHEVCDEPFIMDQAPEYYLKEDDSMSNQIVKFKFSSGITIKATAEAVPQNNNENVLSVKDIENMDDTEFKAVELNSIINKNSEIEPEKDYDEDEPAFVGSIISMDDEPVETVSMKMEVEETPGELQTTHVETQLHDVTKKVKEPVVIQAKAEIPTTIQQPQHSQKSNYRQKAPVKMLNDNFLNNQERAISKLANRIGSHMHELAVFDEVKNSIRDKKMYPETFYKNLQNAIFRSLMIFCDFKEENVPNQNNKGYHKVFTPPAVIEGMDFEDTMIFIARFWNNRNINSVEESADIMEAYCNMFEDYRGIQEQWLDILKERIKMKMPIEQSATEKIIDIIKREWCCACNDETTEVVKPEPESVPDNIVEEIESSNDEGDDETAFEGNFDMNSDSLHVDVAQNPVDEDEDYSDDDGDYDLDGSEYLTVEIYPDTDEESGEGSYDIIKVRTAEAFGQIAIPFYANFSDNGHSKAPSVVDDRNGVWDWLIHMVPDMMFRTNDPEKWLEVNEEEKLEDQLHIVILDENHGNYTMGIYYLSGIYIVDDEGVGHPTLDTTILSKLNQIICEDIGYNRISHLRRSLSMKELIKDESYIENAVQQAADDNYDSDYVEDETENYDEGDAVKMTNHETEEGMSSAEDAALRAMMGGGELPYNDEHAENIMNEPEYEEEVSSVEIAKEPENIQIHEEVVKREEPVNDTQNETGSPVFQPIRRRK